MVSWRRPRPISSQTSSLCCRNKIQFKLVAVCCIWTLYIYIYIFSTPFSLLTTKLFFDRQEYVCPKQSNHTTMKRKKTLNISSCISKYDLLSYNKTAASRHIRLYLRILIWVSVVHTYLHHYITYHVICVSLTGKQNARLSLKIHTINTKKRNILLRILPLLASSRRSQMALSCKQTSHSNTLKKLKHVTMIGSDV